MVEQLMFIDLILFVIIVLVILFTPKLKKLLQKKRVCERIMFIKELEYEDEI